MNGIVKIFGAPIVPDEVEGGNTLSGDLQDILQRIIGALALVAVVVIIVGGINYMTSGGDSGKVKTARNTILYGAIGLVICALAFAIVNFVVGSVLQ